MHDILAHASSYETRSHSLRFAAQVAKLFHGSLTGIFVAEPVMPVPEMGMPPLFPEIVEVAAEVIREAQKAGGAFQSWAETMGVKQSRWQVAVGHLPSVLAGASNWHDLLVLESAIKAPWSSIGALGQVLLTCGAPCLVVPDTYGRDASLKTIAIASNGTAESVRAVHAALPLLRLAERIELIQGSRPGAYSTIQWMPPLDVEGYLARQGLRFSKRTIDGDDDSIGAALLKAAWETRADLLVMGAYGRTRFSEWALGGATRHVLEHGSIPLFLRH
jgi:nucleotide-binding universal stress UspA family protein